MTLHIFYYKFPRIQVDLIHEEVENWVAVRFARAPVGAFLYTDRWWKRRSQNTNDPSANVEVPDEKVPKDIRLLKLLLT